MNMLLATDHVADRNQVFGLHDSLGFLSRDDLMTQLLNVIFFRHARRITLWAALHHFFLPATLFKRFWPSKFQ